MLKVRLEVIQITCCPLFVDYTRNCLTQYRSLFQTTTLNICESEDYQVCPLYQILIKKVECCEYTKECDKIMHLGNWGFKYLKYITKNYCFYGNKKKCMIYQLRQEEKEIPKGLKPNGDIQNSPTINDNIDEEIKLSEQQYMLLFSAHNGWINVQNTVEILGISTDQVKILLQDLVKKNLIVMPNSLNYILSFRGEEFLNKQLKKNIKYQ